MTTPAGRTARAIFILSSFACLLSAGPSLASTSSRSQQQQLVPVSNWNRRHDASGFQWQLDPGGGYMRYGTNSCFNYLNRLIINGNHFGAQQQMMTPDGSEYVFTGAVSGVAVTRRVRIDLKASLVRFTEVLTNTSQQKMNATISLYSEMGTNFQSLISDRGAALGFTLGKGESGVAVVHQQNSGRPSVLFWLAAQHSKAKPTVNNNSNYYLTFTYTLELEPGKPIAILHAAAQRNLGATDAKSLAVAFSALKSRKLTLGLPTDIKRSLVNLRGSAFDTIDNAELLAALESLDVERSGNDILALGEETRLRGTASCAHLSVETAHGRMEVPFEKVAALTGERYAGKQSLVFLRDGQVLSGRIEVKDLIFVMTSGIDIVLAVQTLDRLVMRALPDDGKPNPDAFALVETFDGDRLLLSGGDKAALSLVTPWGSREIPLEDVFALKALEEDQAGHRINLKDGSRFFAFLDVKPLVLKTLFFGERKILPTSLRALVSLHERPGTDEDQAPVDQPYVVLAGENLLVGKVDLPAIHVVSSGEVVPLQPEQIKEMHNVSEGGGDTHAGPAFSAEMWGGGIVSGQLRETVLPIRAGDAIWQVPVRDIVDLAVPIPSVPDSVRERLARLIRDLGHPEWEVREKATSEIAELGYLAKQQLTEAYNQTQDPEVRRRARMLLDGLKD